jgi:hypothetical protein
MNGDGEDQTVSQNGSLFPLVVVALLMAVLVGRPAAT